MATKLRTTVRTPDHGYGFVYDTYDLAGPLYDAALVDAHLAGAPVPRLPKKPHLAEPAPPPKPPSPTTTSAPAPPNASSPKPAPAAHLESRLNPARA
ncbi:hypothetical protein EDE04_7006 [Streptomyces sp. 2132.2]|nr:hypothetical protein EDE04_7006 [Streptomyces sp. 2132.2]